MEMKGLLDSIVFSPSEYRIDQIFQSILPPKNDIYSLDDIDKRIYMFRDALEELERSNNDHFDKILDTDSREQIQSLSQKLHNVQLNVMKLQCDIAYAKDQLSVVDNIKNNKIINERQELLSRDIELKQILQQLKFDPLKEFYTKFSDHLENVVTNHQKLSMQQTSNFHQLFDWTQYNQVMFLLRAGGKAMIDVHKLERLYQSNYPIEGMVFKHPIEQMDYNNYIEFQDTYSLESQLEIINKSNQHQDLKDFLQDQEVQSILNSSESFNYSLFNSIQIKFKSINIDCCKLIVHSNTNYIDANLMDGINIHKLNKNEDATLSKELEQHALPLYAFSPQEYITQIGQHLLTLRKQTEQFDMIDNASLKFGLEFLQQAQDIQIDTRAYATVTEIVMRCIARHCVRSVINLTGESILSKLTNNGRYQLATDILYLDNVLEDLKLLNSSEPNVEKFKSLLNVE